MPFSAKMVKRRHNALGFSIQLRKLHMVYLASVDSYTSRCVSSIWLGAFLENRRKAQEHRRSTLTCLAVLSVRLGESPRRVMGFHHNRDGVKARYVLSGWVRQNIQGSGSASRRRGEPKIKQGDERPRRRLRAGGRAGRTRRVSAA